MPPPNLRASFCNEWFQMMKQKERVDHHPLYFGNSGIGAGQGTDVRERKMRTNFFCTNFLNTPRGPGHPGKIPGTSQSPLFETQGRQTFEGVHEVFGHHPFEWKTPTPPGGLQTQKVYLCALFSCLRCGGCSVCCSQRQHRPQPALFIYI